MESTNENMECIIRSLRENERQGIFLEETCSQETKIKHFIAFLFELGEGN